MDNNIIDWAMYEKAGNLAVSEMMLELKIALKSKPLPQVRCQLHTSLKELGKEFGEVFDTEVRNIIASSLSNWACEIHELDPVFGLNSEFWNL